MASRHRFQVDGQSHTVIVDERPEGTLVTVDGGEPVLFDVTSSGVPGLFSLIHDGRPVNAYVARRGKDTHVVVEGRTFVLAPAGAAGRGRGAVGGHADPPGVISAPLAGVLVDIRVKPGDLLEPRMTVVVIEAMKMQNEVQAPLAGVVGSVRVSQGARIEKGEVILEYEPAEEAPGE